MAISFVGSAVGSSSPNTGTSIDISGGGLQADDLILVAAAVGDTANNGLAAPTQGGYSRVPGVAASLYANDTNDVNLDLYYKIADGTETAVSFGAVGGNNASNAAVVMAFRGVDTTTPFDVNAATATGIDTSNADPPSLDHNNPSGVWTVLAAATGHTGGATATFTFPTNYTTNAAQRAHNDTIDVLVGMGYRTNPADPENPGALSAANIGTASGNAWAAVTMALRPASPIVEADGSAAGSATPAAIGAALWVTVAAVTGAGSAATDGATVLPTAGASAGVAAGDAVGEDGAGGPVEADGAAGGAATVSGVGVAIAAGAQSAAGTGDSVFSAAALWVGQALSTGVALLTSTAAALWTTLTAAVGLGTASGEGVAIGPVEADGMATASASASGVGENSGASSGGNGHGWSQGHCAKRLYRGARASQRAIRGSRFH